MNYDFKYINFEDLKEGDELYIYKRYERLL